MRKLAGQVLTFNHRYLRLSYSGQYRRGQEPPVVWDSRYFPGDPKVTLDPATGDLAIGQDQNSLVIPTGFNLLEYLESWLPMGICHRVLDSGRE
jgi:hypothetical protein